jgi:hypothetical protein
MGGIPASPGDTSLSARGSPTDLRLGWLVRLLWLVDFPVGKFMAPKCYLMESPKVSPPTLPFRDGKCFTLNKENI